MRDRLVVCAFTAGAFVLAFCQRPGLSTSDTKIDLHVDPGTFLAKVASVWNPSMDLGAVQSAQYSGYLWPMGPFFAAFQGIGVSPWVTERLWLAVIYTLTAWGAVKLMDEFVGRPRGIAHVAAAGFYLLNPYTATFTGRTSIALLGYAALPWLLVVVHRGVRETGGWRAWRSWWWPAAFALILTSTGGGVNGAVVGWMLVGTLALMVYEPLVGHVRWRDSGGFVVRAGVLGLLASLWWIVPLMVSSRYGIDFLRFTEGPTSIWSTNSATETIRLMGYWTSYIGVGFWGAQRAMFTESGALLFNPLVVGASLIIPGLAIAGFVWTRRWRYAPFFLLVLLVGVVIEVAGFPNGTPARQGMDWIYHHVTLLRFMRTTQKAAPLTAIGLAGLLGLAAHVAWAHIRSLSPGRLRLVASAAAPAALAGLIALAALPLIRGTAIEKQLTWKRIPAAWTDAGRGLDRTLAPNTRALVLPGQVFANYTWGTTIDAILPRVTRRPVAVRYETPYSDPHAFDLLWTVDGLVQQNRLLPGQLQPLLRLMGVGAVVTGTDDDTTQSGAIDPATAARALDGQGLGRPAHAYGPVRRLAPPRQDFQPRPALPEVRRYDVRGSRGIVHVDPLGPPTVVDGDAQGVADLAAFGALPANRPLFYAGDLSTARLRADAASGADVVVSDSNRRRQVLPEFSQQNVGPVLGENDPLDPDQAFVDPFPTRGSDAQTVAVLQGASYVRGPSGGGLLAFPEHAPIAAFDGSLSTSWAAARYLLPSDRWLQIGFQRPRDVPYVDLYPVHDPSGIERQVDINGVRASLHAGWNHIPVGLHHVSAVRITLTKVQQPRDTNLRGGGGFREIRIPGVHVTQSLRAPVVVAKALAGRDLSHTGLTYLFERTTADQPFQRDRQTGSPLLEIDPNRSDSEAQINRVVFAPAPRAYRADAWVFPAVTAPDSALDALAGRRGGERFDSSGRFHDQARYRASSAFDGDPGTAWIGTWAVPSSPNPWISWTTPAPLTVSHLRLVASSAPIMRPTRVRLSWPGGASPPLAVAPDGSVTLPAPARARSFRLTVLAAGYARPLPARDRSRAVGIASLEVPGLRTVAVPRSGPLQASCGTVRLRVAGRDVLLRPEGTVADLDAGRPLRAVGCSGPVHMAAGVQRLRSLPGTFSVDLLRLSSPAPQPPAASVGGGAVVSGGHVNDSSVTGAQVRLRGPSWLVLGQSFSKGWEATCDGRSLGAPQPIDGYANGWQAPASCRRVAFTFGPQRAATAGSIASAAFCLALVAFLIVGGLRGARRRPALTPLLGGEVEDRPRRLTLPAAAIVAAVATAPLALLFAVRTSVAIFPVLTFLLWRGIRTRLITAVAAALIGVVVPIAYAIINPRNHGGFNFEYSLQLIWAHWIGVGAIVLLMVACWRALAAARRANRRPGPPPASSAPPDSTDRSDAEDLDLAPA